jgi:CubicO group peptidase (beta-lactamase class C family)
MKIKEKRIYMKNIAFERVFPEEVGIPSGSIQDLLDLLESCDHSEPHGIMIMRHGKVCAEGWWAPYGALVPHALFSLTKTYTATAVGIAYTQGLLHPDDRILDYFPEFRQVDPGEYIKELRLRDLLNMSSGKDEIRGNSCDWRRHFFEIPIRNRPGTQFTYNCEDTHMCMAVLQKVTGQGLHEYLASNLFSRIGIDSSNLKWVYLPDGSEVGCGGLFATVEDSLRLMKLYLQGGVWEGERILAADYVAQAAARQIPTENAEGHPGKINGESIRESVITYRKSGYGYQLWMLGDTGAFCGTGALGQMAIAVPQLHMVISFYQTAEEEKVPQILDNILGILLPAAKPAPLAVNREAGLLLAKRLSKLSLGNPRARPCPELLKEISGSRFRIFEGTFTLFNAVWDHITSSAPFPDIEGAVWFSFEYVSPDICLFRFEEAGLERVLEIGLDGVRRLNHLALPNTTIDKVVLDGAWIGKNVFHLNARWIETCYSITVSFRFLDRRVEISAVRIFGDYHAHPLRIRGATAILL